MSITHANFLTQVRNYTEVDSNVLSDTLLDQFIRNTELDIAGKVDYDDIRKYVTGTTGTQKYLNVPDDCIVIRSIQVISNSTRDFLEKRDTSFIAEFNPTDATGLPKYFANWDDKNILFAPIPDQNYDVQLNYIKDPEHFNSTTETFLSKHQEALLLYGVLTECFSYLKGPMDMYNLYKTKYTEEIQAFMMQQMGRRRRSEYDNGVMRIPLQSPSP
jgi:hypothetical protein|tara:strand:+ start:1568 stop:2215 length:648 start_codon:yes stop_codon:yes gene_type:complete